MFAPRQPATISETGVSVARFFEGTTPSGGGASFFPAYPNPFEGLFDGVGEGVACLSSLFDEMSTRTEECMQAAARDGNYLTALSGIKYIPEDRSDAFGHCWIGCRGTQHCGERVTAFYGENYENWREIQSFIGYRDHNSYEEDIFNQRAGRQLARANPTGDAFALAYQALVAGQLHFHGHNTGGDRGARIYVCEDIVIEGHRYEAGWRIVPWEILERF